MGSGQNYGPFFGILNMIWHLVLRGPKKGTTMLTTTHNYSAAGSPGGFSCQRPPQIVKILRGLGCPGEGLRGGDSCQSRLQGCRLLRIYVIYIYTNICMQCMYVCIYVERLLCRIYGVYGEICVRFRFLKALHEASSSEEASSSRLRAFSHPEK